MTSVSVHLLTFSSSERVVCTAAVIILHTKSSVKDAGEFTTNSMGTLEIHFGPDS